MREITSYWFDVLREITSDWFDVQKRANSQQRGLTHEQLIANYRISRARRVVENAFGILAQRWQLLLTTMMQQPDIMRLIVGSCVCLHNIMRVRYPTLQNAQLDMENQQHDLVPGLWRATARNQQGRWF